MPKPNARAVEFERVVVDDTGAADQVGGVSRVDQFKEHASRA